MSSLSDDDRRGLETSEAYLRCIQALDPVRPDYEAAQVYAVLALEDSLRQVVAQFAELGGQINGASRRR